MKRWLIYGANGYTGELIAREARRRGLRPVLAGRNPAAIEALAAELDLPARVFGLDGQDALRGGLEEVGLVLHCAGPFSATAAPMLEACLSRGAHYLDITGEIAVFEAAHALGDEARAARAVLCPGVGFDVVPTDCLAAELVAALPDATYLALGFDSLGPPSRGTARTTIEGIAGGGRIRSAGRIIPVAQAFRVRDIDFGDGRLRSAVTIPWGDVATAYYTTGIPNIEVYMSMPPARITALRRMGRLGPLLGSRMVQSFLKSRVREGGPDEAARAGNRTHVWGEVQAPSGELCTGRIEVGNGYEVTVHAALGVVERMLAYDGPGGYHTPSQLMGSRYVETLPGSGSIQITRGRAWQSKPG